jgi:metal-dependent amidase/aminoacylase/carboxypeptidase family protein
MASIPDLLASASLDLSSYEALYKQFHSHPELSNQEVETAATCAARLSRLGVFELHTKIGGHGLAGVFENGLGKKVMLRADMDALPVEEKTGLPYASQVEAKGADGVMTRVMHACGHDMQ